MGVVVTYVTIAYFTAYTAKVWGVRKKWLPVIAAFAGLMCGVLGQLVYGFHKDWFDAIAIGLFSGFSAVGTNEITKYLFGKGE